MEPRAFFMIVISPTKNNPHIDVEIKAIAIGTLKQINMSNKENITKQKIPGCIIATSFALT